MSILSALGFDTGRISKESLRRLNLVMAVLFIIQAVVLLLAGNAGQGSRQVTLGFISKDAVSTATAQASYLPASHHLFDISLLYIAAAVLILAAAAHLAAATVWRATYESDLTNNLNRLRWRLSALTGGLVMVMLALLAGASDLALLILVFAATAGSNLLALLSEQLSQRLRAGERWKFWGSVMPALAAWLAVAIYVKSSYVYGADTPSYVYIIPAVMLALYLLMVFIHRKQFTRNGAWKDYMYTERGYIVLGFISLTALTWQLYGWVLR